MSRGKRRKEAARIFKRRFKQEYKYCGGRASEAENADEMKWATWRARRRLQTNTLCSCTMCASPRKLYGNGKGARTFQELRSALTLREELE